MVFSHRRVLAGLVAGSLALTACTEPPRVQSEPRLETACAAEEQRYRDAVARAQATETILEIGGAVVADIFSNVASQVFGGVLRPDQVREIVGNMVTTLKEDQARIAAYQASFDAVTECRAKRATEIRRAVRRSQIPPAQAEQRMQELKVAQQADIQTARTTNAEIDKRNAKYKAAIDQTRKKSVESGVPATEVRTAEASLTTNQRELDQTERKVERADARVEGTFVISALPAKKRVLPA